MINREKLHRNTMIAIAVIVFYIVISVSMWFFDKHLTDTVEDLLSVVLITLYFFILLFLYYYITFVEKQKMWLSPIVLIVASICYREFYYLYPFWEKFVNGDNSVLDNNLYTQILPVTAPSLIIVVAELTLAFQLIRNQAVNNSSKIKLIGISFSLPFLTGIMYTALILLSVYITISDRLIFQYYPAFTRVVGYLPFLSMLNLYISSIRRTIRNSEIATEV